LPANRAVHDDQLRIFGRVLIGAILEGIGDVVRDVVAAGPGPLDQRPVVVERAADNVMVARKRERPGRQVVEDLL